MGFSTSTTSVFKALGLKVLLITFVFFLIETQLTPERYTNMDIESNSQSPTALCDFHSYPLPIDKATGFIPAGRGTSLKSLLASAGWCRSCRILNNGLQTKECELHEFGKGATLPLDLYIGDDRDRLPTIPTCIEVPWHLRISPGSRPYEAHLGGKDGPRVYHHAPPTQGMTTLRISSGNLKSPNIPVYKDRRYIALSHQWGTEPFIKLTEDNLAHLRLNIPYRDLRLTFRDAVDVTRELGVRYLWIDSLCIIQGSRTQSDWHQEVKTMASVYCNALLTLAASNAVDVRSGLFSRRKSLIANIGHVQHGSNGIMRPVFLAADPERHLERRGWVVQEHLLAPRTVHMADNIAWKCREVTVKWLFSTYFVFPQEPVVKIWTTGIERSNCFSLWNQTVMRYSGCLLSEPNDKLVAIGGLAKPSWSWASVEGPIKFQSLHEGAIPLVTFGEASSTPVASDEFGELRSGFIEVKVRLIVLGAPEDGGLRDLLYNDAFLRVSLDDFLSTDYGDLYMLPLAKHERDQRYWSLLLCPKPSNMTPQTPQYQRLGIVTTDLKRGLEYFSDGYAPWMLAGWWPRMFYPRSAGEKIAHGFTAEDFDGTDLQSFRLV
ncbi:heterokaryon incompatibility protein-domain-containing protein [Xylariaceae sp. FL1651]|nr:heterokaryon incompatibility protein-domain-containing protein [Xylariaceae sp. FL1651]